ncbi:MAG: PQQ-dependent sugar dehydrogenase [Bacteroidota bacterium]
MKLSNLSFSVSVFLLSGLLSACKSENYQFNIPSSPYPVSEDSFSLDTLAEGFTIPFGLAVVNEDEYFITDRLGDFFHYQQGSLTKIKGTPKVTYFDDPGIAAIKHGGLMDVSLHPNYAQNGWIYMAFLATSGHAKAVRLKVEGDKITELEELFASRDQIYLGNGMRIVWQDAQHFFLNVGGSAYSTRNNPVMLAQDFQMDAGKIHRLLEDGGVPADNPILPGLSSPTSIWSYGHRDAQGFHS